MDATDLSLWTGKPPFSSALRNPSSLEDQSESDGRGPQRSPAPSEDSSEGEGITYDGSPVRIFKKAREEVGSDSESLDDVVPQLQNGFYIDIPSMDEDEKNGYEYLPGHDHADKILSEGAAGRFIVRLMSGDKKLVSSWIADFSTFRNAATWR
jgi:hypothetical protein